MSIRWEKLTVKSQQAMQQAQERAAGLGNPEILPVHLLLALVEDREGVIPAVLEKVGVPAERLEHELHTIEEKLPRVAGSSAQPGICCWAWRTSRAMRRARRWCHSARRTMRF